MSSFEKCSITIYILQTIIFFFTFFGAFFIGIKQNQISKQLLEINQFISIMVLHINNELRIYNKSKGNIWFWGSQTIQLENLKSISISPRLINPEAYYYLISKEWEDVINKKLSDSNDTTFNMELYFTNDLKEKFIANLMVWVQKHEGELKLHTQVLSIAKQNWA